jgi:N-acetyl-gamma-glutamyl-phosphate reductase
MQKVKVGVVGATGYTGAELLRLLVAHPGFTLEMVTSETYSGMDIATVFPSLRGLISLRCVKLNSADVSAACDKVFVALPHTKAAEVVSALAEEGKRVVDFSADFRLKDPSVYKQWYSVEHPSPELLSSAVYGLPELYRQEIKAASIVANPGCYPTSAILALAPVISKGLVETEDIIIDSKSGVSGAGRKVALPYHFAECNESVKAYSVAVHRHTPEIEQEVSRLAGEPVKVLFTPHLVPMTRGILSTIYLSPKGGLTAQEIMGIYNEFYGNEPFVRVREEEGDLPSTGESRASNFCDIGLKMDPRTGRLVVVSAIDNLGKGASWQAVQSMNLLCGFDEAEGLRSPPVYP